MEKKEQQFFKEKFQIQNELEMRETENHHEANTTVIMIADKVHQWMLK